MFRHIPDEHEIWSDALDQSILHFSGALLLAIQLIFIPYTAAYLMSRVYGG